MVVRTTLTSLPEEGPGGGERGGVCSVRAAARHPWAKTGSSLFLERSSGSSCEDRWAGTVNFWVGRLSGPEVNPTLEDE